MRQPNEITHNGKTLAQWLEVNKTDNANLSGANLSGADLSGANLSGADLSWADGKFALFYAGKHHAVATATEIFIGCETHTHAEWRENFEKIGAENDYSADEIERYRTWIFSLDWLVEEI